MDAVWLNVDETRHQRLHFTRVRAAEAWAADVIMKMHVEDSDFVLQGKLHCLTNG